MDEISSKCFEKGGDALRLGDVLTCTHLVCLQTDNHGNCRSCLLVVLRVRLFILNHNIAPINNYGRNNIDGPVYFYIVFVLSAHCDVTYTDVYILPVIW